MRLAAVVACAALTSQGCALFAMNAPPASYQASQSPRCNDGKGAVGVDGLMAGLLGVVALAVAGDSAEGGAIMLVPAAAYAGSAAAGNSSANRCRKAIAEHEAYLAGGERDLAAEIAADVAADHAALAAASAAQARPQPPPTPADPYQPAAKAPPTPTRAAADPLQPEPDEPMQEDPDADADAAPAPEAPKPAPRPSVRLAPRGAWGDFWVEVTR